MTTIILQNLKWRGMLSLSRRHFSSASTSAVAKPAPLKAHRTTSDPGSFTTQNIGQWYTIPVAHLAKLSYKYTLPSLYASQVETLLECSVMVRLPFVDLANCLRHMNPDAPVCRYVIFGPNGTGKSVTLWQAAHFAHAQGWVVCHVPIAKAWTRLRTELTPSSWKPDRFDLPLLAAQWLTRFKASNEELLNHYKLVTTKDYSWTARENTPSGSPLMELVELGIARPILASDCVGALLRELKIHAKAKRVKVMIAIRMVNSFFVQSRHRRPDGLYMHASEVSLVHNITKMLSNDWNNGAIVTTVDRRAEGKDAPTPELPYNLLGQEGFETMDPFVPIGTKIYTDHEANSCLDYYTEMNWIQRPSAKTEEGRLEIIHMCARNPLLLERTISSY